MKKILVTGSNGQLGSELKSLSDNYSSFSFFFHDIETLDLTSKEQIKNFLDELNPDYIINCAAYTAVDKAEAEIKKAYELNATVPYQLALLTEKYSTKLIHISTDYVFNGTQSTPYREIDAICPASSYGKSKAEGEQAIKNMQHVIIIRTSWLYSSYGNNFVKSIMKHGREKGELRVVYDQVGTPTYARDLAVAIMSIINKTEETGKYNNGIYHFSNEGVCSWFDFALEIIRNMDIQCNVIPIETKDYPTPAKRPAYSVFNKSRIKSTFGIVIPYWKDSLADCLKLM